MKRDWDCIRAILLGLEALGDDASRLKSDQVPGFDPETVSHHIAMLKDAGLIEGTCTQPINGPRFCVASRMTWAGHELLDSIRSQSVWQKVREIAREKGLSLTFEVVKTVASQVLESMLR